MTTLDAPPEAPPTAAPRTPTLMQALAAVMRDIQPVGKDKVNTNQGFNFRGIDDLMDAVSGPMRAHGVMMFPEVLEERHEVRGKSTVAYLKVRYTFVGPANDERTITVIGEAADTYDKATNKAMSAALKYALLQTYMIPVKGNFIEDSDRHSPDTVPSPADWYLTQLRKPEVWNSSVWLVKLHDRAKDASVLGAPVDDGGTQTTLGDLIANRAKQLKAEADARAEQERLRKEAEAAHQSAEQGDQTGEQQHNNAQPQRQGAPASVPPGNTPEAPAACGVPSCPTPHDDVRPYPSGLKCSQHGPAAQSTAQEQTGGDALSSGREHGPSGEKQGDDDWEQWEPPAGEHLAEGPGAGEDDSDPWASKPVGAPAPQAAPPAPAAQPVSGADAVLAILRREAEAQAGILGVTLAKHLEELVPPGGRLDDLTASRLRKHVVDSRVKVCQALQGKGRAQVATAYLGLGKRVTADGPRILEELPEEYGG